MPRNERKRRPVLERTKPIRNWGNAVSAGPVADEQRIGQDVQNANRVIEDYLAAGRATAQRFGIGRAASVLGSTEEIAQRVVRAASDSMNLWLEFMARSSASGLPPQAQAERATASAPTVTAPSPETDDVRVAVEVDSVTPVTVSVAVRRGAQRTRLSVDRLHRRDAGAAPLTGIQIEETRDQVLTVRMRIAPEQQAGAYHGVIIDEATSLPAGTISVDIRHRRPVAARKRR